jgi:hypothetical protein
MYFQRIALAEKGAHATLASVKTQTKTLAALVEPIAHAIHVIATRKSLAAMSRTAV